MSHYDKELEIEWSVLVENRPSRELVLFDDASRLELEVAKYVLEAQAYPSRREQWASFFGGERQSIFGGFNVEMDTREVLWDESVDLEEAIVEFQEELGEDSVVSSLYRLRVPFRVLVKQNHSEGHMNRPALVFHIAESVELLDSLPPEPSEVIKKREDGIQMIGSFMGVPDEDNGYIVETEERFPGCSIGEWESIIGRAVTDREELVLDMCVPYIPRPTVDGFERAMAVGLPRLDVAEEVSESLGVDLYSYREDVDEDFKE